MNGQMRNWLNGMISEFVKNSPENSLKMEPDEKAWACLHSRFTTVDLFKNLMDILGPDKGFRVLVVDLSELFHEVFVFGKLERFYPVRLETMRFPNPSHCAPTYPLSLRHSPCAPMGGVRRC